MTLRWKPYLLSTGSIRAEGGLFDHVPSVVVLHGHPGDTVYVEHGLAIDAEVGCFDLIAPVVELHDPPGVAGSVEHGLAIGAEHASTRVPLFVVFDGHSGNAGSAEHGLSIGAEHGGLDPIPPVVVLDGSRGQRRLCLSTGFPSVPK